MLDVHGLSRYIGDNMSLRCEWWWMEGWWVSWLHLSTMKASDCFQEGWRNYFGLFMRMSDYYLNWAYESATMNQVYPLVPDWSWHRSLPLILHSFPSSWLPIWKSCSPFVPAIALVVKYFPNDDKKWCIQGNPPFHSLRNVGFLKTP